MKTALLFALLVSTSFAAPAPAPVVLTPGQTVEVTGTMQIGTGPEVIRIDLVKLDGAFTATVAGAAVAVDTFALAPEGNIDVQVMAQVFQHPVRAKVTGVYAWEASGKHHMLGVKSVQLLPASRLTPPWYYVHAQVRAALEGGPVKVLELEQHDGHWVVPVAVSGPDAARTGEALAALLKRPLLGGQVKVEVRLPGGAVAGAANPGAGLAAAQAVLHAALDSNVHVSGIFEFGGGVLIEMKPEILSFYADNLSDRKGLAHFPGAQLMQEVLDLSGITGTPVRFGYAAQ